MVANEQLIRDRELASAGFIRDLKAFLELPEEALLAIATAEIGDEGFVGQTGSLNSQFGISMDRARGGLQIADYLYRRTADLGLEVAEAVGQIIDIATGMELPVAIDDNHQRAIAALLSFKRDYEEVIAIAKAVANGPHFIGVDGSWSVKPIQMPNGEFVRIPVVSLSITWHDGLGHNKEPFFHMAESDWEDFASEVAAIANDRSNVEMLL